jgi:hypothetical protein
MTARTDERRPDQPLSDWFLNRRSAKLDYDDINAVRALEVEIERLTGEVEAAREFAAFYKSAYETADEAVRQMEAHAQRTSS